MPDVAPRARLLCLDPAGNLWGSERALLDSIKSLTHFEVAICCPPGKPLGEQARLLGIRVLPYFIADLHEKSRWARLWAAWGVLRACLVFRPDVLHLNQAGCFRVASIAARLLGIPTVVHVRIFEDAAYLAKQRPLPSHLRAVVAVSRSMVEELSSCGVAGDFEVATLYDCYDSGGESSAGLSLSERNVHVACVGRIVPVKGQDILVEAISLLWSQGAPVRCLMIGSGGAFMKDLQDRSAKSDEGRAIEWCGFQANPLDVMGRSLVAVIPSHREPLGRVIFEAWTAGCVPVVFRGSGGAAEVIASSSGGILYDEQTPKCLADALRRAVSMSDSARAQLVESGRKWMVRECSPTTHAVALQGILRRARLRRNG